MDPDGPRVVIVGPSQESIEANEAFYLAGGWVVPFGCAVVE